MKRLLLIAAVLFAAVLSAGAQDAPLCGGLSAPDCALYTAAQGSLDTLDAASFTLDAQIIQDGGTPITITGDGAFVGAAGLAPEFSDVNSLLPALVTGSFDAALNLRLGGTMIGDVDLQLRLIDGIGYINFDALANTAEALGTSLTEQGLTGWGGLNLVETLDVLTYLPPMTSITVSPDLFAPEMLDRFTTITRGADVDGAAVFTVTLDLPALLADEDMRGLFGQVMVENSRLSEEEIVGALDTLADGLTASSYQAVYTVAAEGAAVQRIDTSLFLSTELSRFALNIPAELAISWNVTFGDPMAIEVPEGAVVADTDEVLGSLPGN